jgi:hypothetical protein
VRLTRRDGDNNRDSLKLWRVGLSELIPTNPQDPGSGRSAARWLFLLAVAEHAPEVLADLRGRPNEDDLGSWAQAWNLPAWAVPYAQATRRFWSEHLNAPNVWLDRDDVQGALVPDEEEIHPPTYDPRTETRAVYQRRVDAYITACESAAEQQGFTRRPRKDPRAYHWLVESLVHRKTYADLWRADSSVTSRNTIRNACVELTRLLDDEPAQK